jgi:WD40 repeat protein/tetratricopeptide (TPR) repeat protein
VKERPPPLKGLSAFMRAFGVARGPPNASAPTQSGYVEPAEDTSSWPQPTEARLRPFPGLRSFENDDSDVFFGRQKHIDALLGLLGDQQVIAVLGGSGSGKSSVVRAGVIPALTSTYKIESRLGRWYVAECKPGRRPVDELSDALWEQICSDLVLSRPNGGAALAAALGVTGELREQLSSDTKVSGANKTALRRIFDRELRPKNRLNAEGALWFASDVLDRLDRELNPALRSGAPSIMLVIDQFEELFGPDVNPQQRDDLLALLKRVFEGSQERTAEGFYIVITMRSEELHRCAEFLGLSEIINGSMYLIDLMDDADLREAIVRPARRVFEKWELPFSDEATAPFDPKFVDWLLSESSKLRESLIHKPDQLPLLQHALRLIWSNAVERWSKLKSFSAQDLVISFQDKPKSEQAAGIGFLRGCLNVAADMAFEDAAAMYDGSSAASRKTSDAERLLRAFFVALARRDDRGNWVRRLATRRELLDLIQDRPFGGYSSSSAIPFDEARFDKALNVFVARAYLMTRHAQEDASRCSYEVCHEALIRHWQRYQQWLYELGEVARSLRQVAENLLPPQIADVPDRWPELKRYGHSLLDWWGWIRAVREKRAVGIVSEYNREKLGLLFGDEAKFGSQLILNELVRFLKERNRRRGTAPRADERYESEARGLLDGIADAYVLAATPRLTFPRTLAGFPQYLVGYAKHPDNRLVMFSGVMIYAALVGMYLIYANLQESRRVFTTQQEVNRRVLEAMKGERDRLVESRQYFAAQTDDRLLGDNQIELARLVALNAIAETAPDPQGKLRQSLDAIIIAQGRGPLLLGTDASKPLIAVAPNGAFVAGVPLSAGPRGIPHTIRLWDPSSGATIRSLAGLAGKITTLVISRDGQQIAAGSADGEVIVWSTQSGDVIAELSDDTSRISALAFSQDGTRLISGASDNAVQLWDIGKQAVVQRFTIDESCPKGTLEREQRPRTAESSKPGDEIPHVVAVATNMSGNRLVASTSSRRIILWDVPSGRCLQDQETVATVIAIAFGSKPWLVVANERGAYTATIDAENRFRWRQLEFPNSTSVSSISFDATQRQFLFVTPHGAVFARESDRGNVAAGIRSRDDDVGAPVDSTPSPAPGGRPPSDQSVASEASSDGIELIRLIPKTGFRLLAMDMTGLWSVVQADQDEKQPLQVLRASTHSFVDAGADQTMRAERIVEDVSDDGRYVAIAHRSKVRIIPSEGGKEYPLNLDANVLSLRFDPTNKRLAIGLQDGDVHVWSFENETQPKPLEGHYDDVNSVAFDQSGQRLISASEDNTVIVWDVERGKPYLKLYHGNSIIDAAFAADDIGIVTLSRDGSLRIYDSAGALLEKLPGTAEPRSMALDQSRSRAIVLDSTNTVQIWNLRSKLTEGTIRLSHLSSVGFGGEPGEIVSVSPSGIFAIWLPDGTRVKAYGDVSSVVGGWTVLNPTGRNVLTFGGSRAIRFNSEPRKISEAEVRSIIEAAGTRKMTTRELQLYASPPTIAAATTHNQSLQNFRPTCLDPTSSSARTDPLERCVEAVKGDPSDAQAWYEFGRARERSLAGRSDMTEASAPDPGIVVAAALGGGPALVSLGDWFSSRKLRSAGVAGLLYGRAILNDAESGESYRDWLTRWGDLARDDARRWRQIFEQRADSGDPGAHFILGVLAERSVAADQDLERAFFHYAVAQKLFEQRGIDSTAAAVRRSALARMLPPDRVVMLLRSVKARHAEYVQPAAARAATAPGSGVPPQTTFRPDLASFDPRNEADIADLAHQAIDALNRLLKFNDELDVLRGELLLAQAKRPAKKGDPSRVKLLERANSLFEAEMNRDPSDATSFDRRDETLALLSDMQSAGDCAGSFTLRMKLFDQWPKRHSWTKQRRLSQIDAEARLVACLQNAGQTADVRLVLTKAAEHLRTVDQTRGLTNDTGEKKLVALAGSLADAFVKVGDRENALPLYAKALAASGVSLQTASSQEIDAYIDLQRRTVAAWPDRSVDSAATQAFSKFGDVLRSIDANRIAPRYPAKAETIFRESIVILRKLVQAEPQNAQQKLLLWLAYDQMGRMQRNRKDTDGALKSYQDALAVAKTLSDDVPSSTPLLLWTGATSQIRIGDVLQEKGNNVDAMKAYQDALAMIKAPANLSSLSVDDTSDIYYLIGGMFLKAEQYQLAVEATDAITRIQPTNANAWNRSCWIRAILDQLQDALADCNKSLQLQPKDEYAFDSRGFTYLKLGELDRSIADYDARLTIRPRAAYSLYGRGMAKLRRGDTEDGNADISMAKKIESDIADIFARLGVR